MKLHQSLLLVLHTAYCLSLALPSDPQTPIGLLSALKNDRDSANVESKPVPRKPQRIAIIGSGITGSVAAYTIAEAGRLDRQGPPSITLFERNPIIGGRITTAQVYGDPRYTIDTCAATFSSLSDTCISMSAMDVGLAARPITSSNAGVGVWDGVEFQGFIEDEGFRNPQTWSLFRKLRWFRRYGNVPFEYEENVTSIQANYRSLGNTLFTSLEGAVETVNLEDFVRLGPCESGLLNCTDSESSLFLQEVIEAGVRERFFGSVDKLNGLDAVLGFNGEALSEVVGGNLRLVDRLIKLSGVDLRLNTVVQNITRKTQGVWRLDFLTASTSASLDFDAVIIAAPLSLSNLVIEPKPGDRPGLLLPYVDTFVTHFTTTRNLSSSYFNVDSPVPRNILTTGLVGDRSPPFFQLRHVGQYQNPNTSETENLYKLVSEQLITDEEIGEYLKEGTGPPTQPVISWIYREPLLSSVPRPPRNQTIFGDILLEQGLFYAGAGEQVTATIEFGCRMGRNVARLVFPREPGNRA